MGQKVNPVGLRIGVNKNWNSRWYANDQEFHVFLNEDVKVREFLEKKLKEAGYEVVNPAKVGKTLPENTTHEEYMTMSFAMMDICEAV